jgi:hypothetical protein
MRKTGYLIFAVIVSLLVPYAVSSQGTEKPRNRIRENKINTVSRSTQFNGFESNSAAYDIVNIPGDGRTNVIKINGRDCSWNVVNYSLANYRGKTIHIYFSADVMRVGSDGMLCWQVNNEPDYPGVAYLENAESGVWNRMSGSIVITPANSEPFLYLTTWENNSKTAAFYFDNLSIKIDVYDYTPASALQTAGETNSNGTRNFYVSVSRGSDNGNGTQARPFQKIAHAMYYVKPGDTVLLDSGTYHERFKIPSGEAGRPVTFTAMPGANVIITPTIPITPEWRQYAGNIYVADISEYVKDMDTKFPQLFADRDSMVEARYPNMGPSMSAIMDYKRDAAQRGTNKNSVVASSNIPANITGAKLVIWPGDHAGWGAAVSPVQSASGRTIKLAKDLTGNDPYTLTDPNTPFPGNPFYVTGALSLLDAPGEYFFDPQTNLLYFYPPWNGRPDVRALTIRHFNSVVIYAENTSYVSIKNITIYGGSINMQNTRNNTLENCRINYAEHFYEGDWWVIINNAMAVTGSNNRITGCEFGPSAGSGITLGGDDNIFTNNIVHDAGYSGDYAAGVFVLESKRLEISHNTITNSSDVHVFFQGSEDISTFDHCVIRNNYFENHAVLTSDAGAFYAWGVNGGGTEIYNNFIICGDKGDNGTIDKLRMGLYTDNYCYNFIVHHNIVIGGTTGLQINLPAEGTRFYNNTVVGADIGIGFYGYPVNNADAGKITTADNLFVNTKSSDVTYYGTENGRQASYTGSFVNGTIPVAVRPERRMTSSGNANGTVDDQYRPTGITPGIGAIPRGGAMFPYGANWSLGNR